MSSFRAFVIVTLLISRVFAAQDSTNGSVAGMICEQASSRPVPYAMISLKDHPGGTTLQQVATGPEGAFAFDRVPWGKYSVSYALVGGAARETPPFEVSERQRAADLGRLPLEPATAIQLDKLEVSARREAFYAAIDRRVYNVGKDLHSVAGSASDLLQNVPSVQVDLDGNVSLRGDANVLILINGKTSAMMGRNRAAVLEQMPADGIERVEVITNPSAKYKPDGTAGIINLVLKRTAEPGYSGSLRAAVGNSGRYNGNLSASVAPGTFTVSTSVGVRQDDRARWVQDDRSHVDPATDSVVYTSQRSAEQSRPLSRLAQVGVEYRATENTKLGTSVHYGYRDFTRTASETMVSRDASGSILGDYDRLRTDPEYERDAEITSTLQHRFETAGRELNVELRRGRTVEQEDNHYTNLHRLPAAAPTFDAVFIHDVETNTEGTADYSHPINDGAKLDVGYDGQWNTLDMDFRGSSFDPAANAWMADLTRTNRFAYDATIHAFYTTYAQKLGALGVLAGGRLEQAAIDTNQLTTHLLDHNRYGRFYPSLHLTYELGAAQQLQLNYSHRVHRPDADDLNPFPEYQDPFNLHAGNPHLVPEDIHSVEAGWQYRQGDTTYLATGYFRFRYHGITEVTRYLNETTLLTTRENLGISRAQGVELTTTHRPLAGLALNAAANFYRSEIDARNLGFNEPRATIAWEAKLNASWSVSKAMLIQFNTNYTAKRLTPQGYRYPTFVTNVGLRYLLKDQKTSLIVTVSDLLGSLRERTHIDTPLLHQEIIRRRSSRIVYVGVVHHFGKAVKHKDETLPFEN